MPDGYQLQNICFQTLLNVYEKRYIGAQIQLQLMESVVCPFMQYLFILPHSSQDTHSICTIIILRKRRYNAFDRLSMMYMSLGK